MSEKSVDWNAKAKAIRSKAIWLRGGQTVSVVFGAFELDKTKRKNPQTGVEYETEDYVVDIVLPTGAKAKRKVPAVVLAEMIEIAQSQGKNKDGAVFDYTRPLSQRQAQGYRGY